MALEAGNWTLFGLDLRRTWDAFAQGWADALRWPSLAWLSPQEPVQLSMADGSVQWREGLSARPARPGVASAPRAILLPDDIVLFREMRLPDLLQADLEEALFLQVEAHSPFAADDLAWGSRVEPRPDGGLTAVVALASRRQIDSWVAGHAMPADSAEVWVDGLRPIALRGYGDGRRERNVARRRFGILAALALLFVLLLALALTPFLMQRARVFDAQQRQAALETQTAPMVAAREALVRSSAQLAAVRQQLHGQIDAPLLFERLTHLFPDEAYLTRMEINGRQVRIAGFSPNAAGLIDTLGSQPEFAEVRTPAAISRSPDGRESFTVDFVLRDDAGGQ